MQNPSITKFALIPKKDDISQKTAATLQKSLLAAGFTENNDTPDLVVVVGGDGSMLYAAQRYLNQLDHLVFIGIHTGTLGFFMDYTKDEIPAFISDLTSKQGTIHTFPLLKAIVGKKKLYAINEVRIENPMRTQDVTIYLNNLEFETLRSSGLCVSTQLGSTAYNRSLNGPILEENLPALVLTEIAGIHHHKFKSIGVPYVMKDTTEITISANDFEGAYLGVDSIGMKLDGAGEVIIKKSQNKQFNMLRLRPISHFERLSRML
ncbi:NAD(+)/NADH kinase [Candidatus Saccharibacteria bacterium]|nr:NAD(+)/NADH kinase [Candidatus Saccharibacteria bacterium]